MNLDAFKRAVYQDMAELEARGIEYVQKAQLFVPCCNRYWDEVTVRDDNGRKPKFWTSHAYESAAWDYDL